MKDVNGNDELEREMAVPTQPKQSQHSVCDRVQFGWSNKYVWLGNCVQEQGQSGEYERQRTRDDSGNGSPRMKAKGRGTSGGVSESISCIS